MKKPHNEVQTIIRLYKMHKHKNTETVIICTNISIKKVIGFTNIPIQTPFIRCTNILIKTQI